VVFTHPREGVSDPTSSMESLASQNKLQIISGYRPDILLKSRCVIDFGTSMAIDALLRGLAVIFPNYAQNNDQLLAGMSSVIVCDSFSEVQKALSGKLVESSNAQCEFLGLPGIDSDDAMDRYINNIFD
jgi:hypothetical protein